MPLYHAKVSVTRTVNTSWESESHTADAAYEAALLVAQQVWPDAASIEVTIEPIKAIDTE